MKSKVISSVILGHKQNFLNLFRLTLKDKADQVKEYVIASRREIPKVSSQDFTSDAVVIIAMHSETDRMVLLKEYRPSVDGPMIV